MDKWVMRAAVISADPGFREMLKERLFGGGTGATLVAELPVPFTRFSDEDLKALRHAEPDLIFLDLEDDPVLGTKLAQFLADSNPALRFIAVGAELSPELLMAAMRAGVADFLTKPVSPEALGEAVERVGHKVGRVTGTKPREPARVFVFFSPKGGAGSTTVATNLAVTIRQTTTKRVLLVDLDLELGEAALMLGMRPRFNFVDLVQNFHRMDADLLASYIERHETGVDLLSAPYHPEKAEMVTGDQIRRILLFLRQHYDYVLVDTSKSFSQSTLAAFEQADQVFLVTNADLPSLRNIQRGLPMMRRMLVRGDEQLRLVINRFHPAAQISAKDIERSIGLKVFWTLSNDYETVLGSLNSGKPVVLNGSSSFSKDLKALGLELAGIGPGRNGRGSGLTAALRGALGRLTSVKKKGGNSDG